MFWLLRKEFFLCFGQETLHGCVAGKAGIVVVSSNFRLLINTMNEVLHVLKSSPNWSFVINHPRLN